ncbi:transcriptional regulator [Xenorhabdus sp. DI]|uniref:hypothetical protein n=1 Tax=Xenorhabdus doucetiae TaxID=351671 RepID=UPI001988543E|nr:MULTISPECIES: hypothetical protein [unclassified Xenorhabdus]MBD2786644.1 transcriptional regulator [Xenorhabdus sp. 3]MBD2790359.1 transcriptional regulator [Xenorhabdus sp. DI]
MSTMGSRIKEERKRLGLSQGDFANLVGYPCSIQASYENDEIPIAGLHLLKLAERGCDTLYITIGNKIHPMNISIDELELIENYRAMNEASRLNIPTASNTFASKRHGSIRYKYLQPIL